MIKEGEIVAPKTDVTVSTAGGAAGPKGNPESRLADRPPKAPTIYDVAALAGVSHQTVSRYLKGFEGIRPATRARVEEAIRSLEYRPNETARMLSTNRPNRIAAFVSDLSQVGPIRIMLGATHVALEAGYVLEIVPLDASDRSSVEKAIGVFDRPDVAGIFATESTDEVLDTFRSAQFKVASNVLMELDGEPGAVDKTIGVRAMNLAIDHLLSLGHRRFFHLSGPETWIAARIRDEACRRVLARHGLALEETLSGDWSAASGYAAVTASQRDLRGAALLCANDQMAMGACAALLDRGLEVPLDVSVIGVDDLPESAYLRPALTTVRLDFERQGRESMLDLIAHIEGTERLAPVDPSVELVVRSSTAPPLR